MKYLALDQVIRMNAKVLGAEAQVRDLNILKSAVERPKASAFGQDAYPTVHEKAAALFHSLVLNHAFVDGNKRVGVLAVVIFLNENGWLETWDEDDGYHFVIAIAEGKQTVTAIAEWLRKNTEPRTGA